MRNPPDWIEEFYSRLAPNYAALCQSTRYTGPVWLSRKLSELECAPERVLDLGCGPGNLGGLVHARFPQAKIQGLDLSPGMLQKAHLTGDYDRLGWADLGEPFSAQVPEPANLLLSLSVTDYLGDLSVFLNDATTVAAPGAHFLVSFYVGDDTQVSNRLGIPRIRSFGRTPAWIRAELGVRGWKVISEESQLGYWLETEQQEFRYLYVHAERA